MITVALTLRSSTPRTPSDFSQLLTFVIKCITLEDSDGVGGQRACYMGQILTIAGSWVSEKKKRCKLC